MSTHLPNRCLSCDAMLPQATPSGPCPSCGSTQPNTSHQIADTVNLDETPETISRGAESAPEGDGPDSKAPPQRIHLLGEIAHGGMGAVLRGRDERLRREVAVKVLLDQHRDHPEMLRRFVEEAQICGQLQHPGIVPVYESGTLDDRRPYFAMKLVKGQTLAALLAKRSTPTEDLPRFLGIFEQICQAVAYAHARGVIHRDLKPANVMVGGFGEVQVMDWGLAKVLNRADSKDENTTEPDETIVSTARSEAADSDYSRAGSALGTPSYMSPEQARGEKESIDERADVFALGSILCVILTGQPAFTGRSSVEIHGKATRAETADAVARLDACQAGAELTGLAKDCLAPEPADRPRDAGVVRDRMSAYLVGVQERLRTAEVERARAEVRAAAERTRRRLQLGLAAAVLAITTIGGLGFTYELYRRQSREARLSLALNEATLVRDQAREAIDDPARWRAAAEALRGVALALGDAHSPDARARLESLQAEVQNGLAAAQRDATLLRALLAARANELDAGPSATEAAYAAAFTAAGIALDPAHIAEIADELRTRRPEWIVELASYLDHWAMIGLANKMPRANWLQPLELARAIDRDADRDRLRALLASEDLRDQGTQLKALAASAETADWPAPTVLLLASTLPRVQKLALLEQAVLRHPGDVWINFNLADALNKIQPPKREEALRYYTAARALRPETAHNLAHLLQQLNRNDDAEAVFRDLIERLPEDAGHLSCFGRHLKTQGRSSESSAVLDRAIALSRDAVRRMPDNLDAHFNLGRALTESGDLPGSILAYREVLRLQPDDSLAHHNLGVALYKSGDVPGAISEYREAIRLQPDNPDTHASLGDALHKSGDVPGSITAYREAIQLKSDYPEAHCNLGHALYNAGDVSGAITAYRKAIQLRPAYPIAYYNLGLALYKSGDLPGSITAYREAIRLKPDYPVAHTNLGVALYKSGDVPGSITAYRKAIQLKPDAPEAHANLGLALLKTGDVPGAIVAFREAIRLKPDHTIAHQNLGVALHRSGDLSGAIAAYREAIRLRPDYYEAQLNLGNALSESGDLPGAIAACREAIRLRPDHYEAQLNLGNALLKSGDLPGTIAACREAIRLKPDYYEAQINLGNALLSSGDLPRAIAAYREAIRLQPNSPQARYNLGNALLNSDDQPGAIAAYREAIRLQPNHPQAHCNLGLTLRQQGAYAEALAELRIGHELGSKQPGWSYPSAQWVAQAERLVQLSERLQAVLRGEAQPSDNAERLDLAKMAHHGRHYATAARLWTEALEADPKLTEDRGTQHPYNASCAALLAAAGQGQDDPPPDDKAKAALRRQALGWLRAELAAWSKALDTGVPNARAQVARTLQHWQKDPDLASIRDEKALEALSEAERADWRAVWNDVAQLLEKAQPKP